MAFDGALAKDIFEYRIKSFTDWVLLIMIISIYILVFIYILYKINIYNSLGLQSLKILYNIVADYKPEIILYFSGSSNSTYQILFLH